jgi:osmotically-inducible protein OsmY
MKQPLIISSLVIGLFAASGMANAQYGSSSSDAREIDKSTAQPGESSVGQFIDDATVTTRVKTRFAQDDQVSAMNIGVETNDGIVQLSGFAGSEIEKSRAAEIARQVPDVKAVSNNIIVQGQGEGGSMESGTGSTGAGSSPSDSGSMR